MYSKRLRMILFGCLCFILVEFPTQTIAGTTQTNNDAAKVEKIPGSDLAKITLQPKAAERLGINTIDVSAPSNTTPQSAPGTTPTNSPNTQSSTKMPVNGVQSVIPYSALFYDNKGGTWIYVSSKPLEFIRQKIVVDHIEGNQVFLREGPAIGTKVVIVGVDELYGVEKGVSK